MLNLASFVIKLRNLCTW